MTDTTNTLPPTPRHPIDGQGWSGLEWASILKYGDARAAHAVAQIKAREVADAEIDALLVDEPEVWAPGCRRAVQRIVRTAIALANGRG